MSGQQTTENRLQWYLALQKTAEMLSIENAGRMPGEKYNQTESQLRAVLDCMASLQPDGKTADSELVS